MRLSTTPPYFLLAVLLIFTLQACGFKLRGAVELSSEMSPIYFQANSVFQLGREIQSLLKSNKIELVDDEKQSKSQLILISESKSNRVLSVDSDGRAREYLLSYSVNFSINVNSSDSADFNNPTVDSVNEDSAKTPTNADKITISRSLLFDQDAVLAVSNESQVLYKDMRRDAARLILLKLEARSKQ